MKFDLHCHSHFSDGDLSPKQLIALAIEQQITHLALTDHDTVDGLNQAQQAAKEAKLTLINGVEISATWRGQLLHIVGLGVDPNNAELLAGLQQNKQRRFDRAEAMIADLEKHGIEIGEELNKVLKDTTPTRPHFAQALINLGYAKNKQQAFKRYLVKGKPGYIALTWPSIDQVAAWISAAGGVAVLAHPLRYKLTRTKLLTLIDEMKEVGIEAIEVSTAVNDAQQVKMLTDIALQKKLYASIGSDFHSPDQPWSGLGSATELSPELVPVWQALGY